MANGMTSLERAEWERQVREALDASHKAFIGKYRDELETLLSISRADIDAITPDTTDLETYDKLIEVVKLASAHNISQAELKARIEALGAVAISIAKKAGGLAKLLV